MIYLYYKTSYFNEGVNCTEPSPSVSVPCESSLLVFPVLLPLVKGLLTQWRKSRWASVFQRTEKLL